jgi:hypothetical protein
VSPPPNKALKLTPESRVSIDLWYRSGGGRGCSSAGGQRFLVQLSAQPLGSMRKIGDLGHSLSWWLAGLSFLLGGMCIAQAMEVEGFRPPHAWHMRIGVAFLVAGLASATAGVSRAAVAARLGVWLACGSAAALFLTQWL